LVSKGNRALIGEISVVRFVRHAKLFASAAFSPNLSELGTKTKTFPEFTVASHMKTHAALQRKLNKSAVQPLMHVAANVFFEPKVANAATTKNDHNAQLLGT
jgi:hypothetical protein